MITYVKGKRPDKVGVYVCRVANTPFPEDLFLVWDGEHWFYSRSDQRYRGTIAGYIGPLQRKLED